METTQSITSESFKETTINLSSIDWFGFDLDHTLIRYQLHNFHILIYRIISDYLIENYHYNSVLQTNTESIHDYAVKGLIYDSLYGDIIQLNNSGSVIYSLHGLNTKIDQDVLKQRYPDNLQSIENSTDKRYWIMLTYFEQAAAYLIANIVDLIDKQQLFNSSFNNSLKIDDTNKYSFFLSHIYAAFEHNYGGEFDKSDYFNELRTNIGKYIYKRDDIRNWLIELKLKYGKYLFVITNSKLDYTELLANYAFGSDWHSLFDLIIVNSKKPTFFDQYNPFYKCGNESEPISDLRELCVIGGIYTGGNSKDLQIIFKYITNYGLKQTINDVDLNTRKSDEHEPIIIYFGDNIKVSIKESLDLLCETNEHIIERRSKTFLS
ncbi:unnamed protein product [Didymodactylos carnosus]|uniref:Uncharacterized protein n=1 Tax=Didymodactylos carnosus TaxID=1234261 RepID=A0A816AHH7_9BILA|nr:unnamed protein product [Didymodactylos carnosus]CAF1597700.1 unnamed protein product [Didymodactylos carnosus]CAF3811548.1 unnamed protein product [Didymodactylos carnosus]CAF4473272.1 unnamed protein product [Didymodactylos carnosus]